MTRPRVAVFGGTFDPFHLGHLAVAEQSRVALLADECWIVPANVPPLHSPTVSSAADRLAMCRAAAAGHEGLVVVDDELRRDGPSYTVDTMRDLARRHPDVELWIVLGADASRRIGEWQGADELLDGYRFLLVNRAGEERVDWSEAVALGYPADRTRLVQIDSPLVSATEIRRRLAVGEGLEGLVPPPVEEIIRARGLYRDGVGGRAIIARDDSGDGRRDDAG